ncbi:hypothetical protein CSV74_03695 [Sporosarcina sp. P19]|uniref:hypothetical protein n=1 Tax=Sporosarcina sp. P19 TaxID=2048258 RepID=UPI000C16E579|nr:hypothetical protein [Sporosarcina sp. P19]PIC77718.1 hypothetical protein CSV74_03695 [Sporosarcina sp. P19]
MSIKLTPQIKTYASEVANIGGCMKTTADKFGVAAERKVNDIDGIKRKREEYLVLLKEFESQKETLVKLNAPTLLEKEHEQLLISFIKYVAATEKAISSLDIENVKTDENLLREAQDLQWEASREIVQISNAMANKLGI